MRVYVTCYLRGNEHSAGVPVPDMPAPPAVGSTLHWDDYAWCVDHVSWALGGGSYGVEGQWHLELAVSA